MSDRAHQLDTLYQCLDFNMKLATRKSTLGRVEVEQFPELDSPGIYFIFEPDELRTVGGQRVVRVGITDNLTARLKQHLGWSSSFFTLVFAALACREHHDEFYAFVKKNGWKDVPDRLKGEMKAFEEPAKSEMKRFGLTWIPIPELRQRMRLELWATVLLSNYWYQGADRIDPPSDQWLGYALPQGTKKADAGRNEKIRRSGLWSDKLVDLDLTYDCELEFRRLVSP